MAKQKCGSCRFFQEAGLAGSGWCHHPQRKVSSGVMIMVRRNELACRDEWSRSLWVARDTEGGLDAPFPRPPGLGPVSPANADDIRALLGEEKTPAKASGQGEDVLLSEARIVSDAHVERGRPKAPEPAPVASGTFDARSAVFRAREAYRERIRAHAASERQATRVEPERGTDVRHGGPEPAAQGVAAPSRETKASGRLPDPARAEAEPSVVVSAAANARPLAAKSPKLPPIDEPAVQREEHPDPVHSTRAAQPHFAVATSPVAGQSGGEVCPAEPAVSPQAASGEEGSLRDGDERELPAWFRTDLPRICRACRDFRPSADGERGWCANAWAFTHRRLVHEDDMAPCQSSFGDWWVPVDDVWLVAADVSSHSRPTPLLDRLIASESPKRRRS